MNSFYALLAVVAVASASPMLPSGSEPNSLWKGMSTGEIQQLHTDCAQHNDGISCIKYKVMHLLDQIFSKESIQVSENIEIVRNSEASEKRSQSEKPGADILEEIESYIKSHDVIAKLPGTTLTLSPRNFDQDQLSLNLNFSSEEAREGKAVQGDEGRKSKLKKIIIPVLVFVLLKAMTLIPLAIGVLGLKAWNALQLSFFSFVISVALAIFQLCKKIAADASSAQVAAHGPWDNYQAAHYVARAFPQDFIPESEAQDLAYRAHSTS